MINTLSHNAHLWPSNVKLPGNQPDTKSPCDLWTTVFRGRVGGGTVLAAASRGLLMSDLGSLLHLPFTSYWASLEKPSIPSFLFSFSFSLCVHMHRCTHGTAHKWTSQDWIQVIRVIKMFSYRVIFTRWAIVPAPQNFRFFLCRSRMLLLTLQSLEGATA